MLGGKAPPTRAPETSCSHDAPCERPFRFRDISRHVVVGRAVHAVYFQGRENDEAGDAARGVPPGTGFPDLSEEWACPRCHQGKELFAPMET